MNELNAALQTVQQELAKAQAALGDAQADLRAVKCGHATPKEARLERELAKAQADATALRSEVHRMNQQTVELQAENARLAAALQNAINIGERWAQQGDWDADTARGVAAEIAEQANGSTALRDLLGPTIQLLERVYVGRVRLDDMRDVSAELTRLRAARDGK